MPRAPQLSMPGQNPIPKARIFFISADIIKKCFATPISIVEFQIWVTVFYQIHSSFLSVALKIPLPAVYLTELLRKQRSVLGSLHKERLHRENIGLCQCLDQNLKDKKLEQLQISSLTLILLLQLLFYLKTPSWMPHEKSPQRSRKVLSSATAKCPI